MQESEAADAKVIGPQLVALDPSKVSLELARIVPSCGRAS